MSRFFAFMVGISAVTAFVSAPARAFEAEQVTICEDAAHGTWEEPFSALIMKVRDQALFDHQIEGIDDPLQESQKPIVRVTVKTPVRVSNVRLVTRPGGEEKGCATFTHVDGQTYQWPE